MSLTYKSRVEGCLFGLAIGDALGRRTEFLSYPKITEQFGPMGPEEPEGNPALVTDDTQMALAVGEAIVKARAEGKSKLTDFAPGFVSAFIDWYKSPDNDRAPGRTCMAVCASLADGEPWHEATAIHSKGCGANMRVQPVGLLTDKHGFTVKKRSQLAQLQAAITHAHPTAIAASDLTAHAIHLLTVGAAPDELLARLQTHVENQRQAYHRVVLNDLWERVGDASERTYITRGWNEVEGALKNVLKAMENPQPEDDPCTRTGDGWKAEEALATALHAFLLYPDDPVMAVRRAAATRGDSDSLACITGALAGASHGAEAWPQDWRQRIEYKHRLQAIADDLAS